MTLKIAEQCSLLLNPANSLPQVQIIVAGDLDETDVRPLNSTPDRPILRRGQQDSFLMAVPRPLGPLQYIRVWHDNSGKGSESSWFLNYIMLRDLQSGDKYHFIANKWLAVDEEDGEVCYLFIYN